MPEQTQLSRGAYTLLELLVVLTIIALLGIFAFPGMRAATQSYRKADSVSTMRNIGTALAGYLTDNGRLPATLGGFQYAGVMGASNQLITYIAPYLGTTAAVNTNYPKGDSRRYPTPREYVTSHANTWLRNRPSTYIYELSQSNRVRSIDGVWLYPFGSTDIPQTPWNTLVTSTQLSTAIALQDIFATNATQTDRPKIGELQNYRTRLFLDWHVDTIKAE